MINVLKHLTDDERPSPSFNVCRAPAWESPRQTLIYWKEISILYNCPWKIEENRDFVGFSVKKSCAGVIRTDQQLYDRLKFLLLRVVQ